MAVCPPTHGLRPPPPCCQAGGAPPRPRAQPPAPAPSAAGPGPPRLDRRAGAGRRRRPAAAAADLRPGVRWPAVPRGGGVRRRAGGGCVAAAPLGLGLRLLRVSRLRPTPANWSSLKLGGGGYVQPANSLFSIPGPFQGFFSPVQR